MATSFTETLRAASQHLGDESSITLWRTLFSTVLIGFWGKSIAVVAVVVGCWFGIRARSLPMLLTCLFLAAVLAYGAPLLRMIGLF